MREQYKSITELARELRKNPTPSEQKLWSHLRKRQVEGCKFLRQKPIIYKQQNYKRYFFIADFYCGEYSLVVELDGKYHRKQKEYDRNRDFVIEQLGITVLRIKNRELRNMETVLDKIRAYLD